MSRQIDLTDAFPRKFIRWFEQEELTEDQETELDAWYDQATDRQLAKIDAFIEQLEQDSLKDRKGEASFFKTPLI